VVDLSYPIWHNTGQPLLKFRNIHVFVKTHFYVKKCCSFPKSNYAWIFWFINFLYAVFEKFVLPWYNWWLGLKFCAVEKYKLNWAHFFHSERFCNISPCLLWKVQFLCCHDQNSAFPSITPFDALWELDFVHLSDFLKHAVCCSKLSFHYGSRANMSKILLCQIAFYAFLLLRFS
jgi:hypothetical protein